MEFEERAANPLAGGIMAHGYQCGMVWGAALAAGAQAYRLFGATPQAQAMAITAAQRAVDKFCAQNKSMNCLEITEVQISSPTLKAVARFLVHSGGGCFRMAAQYPPAALQEISTALSGNHVQVPPAPVSCAALVAQKMGASDVHTVMAAALAGGIGLSGGACGALGAAIWLRGVNRLRGGTGDVAFKSPDAMATVERFLKCSDYEFECANIAGRKFESVEDHAAYVREGGCAAIIEALATS